MKVATGGQRVINNRFFDHNQTVTLFICKPNANQIFGAREIQFRGELGYTKILFLLYEILYVQVYEIVMEVCQDISIYIYHSF